MKKSLIISLVFIGIVGAGAAQSSELHYDFNGSCPPTDNSGNNRDGTCNGGVSTGISGAFNNSFGFDGSDDYVDTGTKFNSVIGDSDVSLSVWLNPDTDPTNQFLFGERNGGTAWLDGFFDNNDGTLRIRTQDLNDVVTYADSNQGNIANEWNHIVFTYDKSTSTSTLYWNGTQVDQNSSTSSLATSVDSTLLFGQEVSTFSGGWWDGGIDEPRVYSSVLTQSQVSELYNQNNLGKIPSVSNPDPADSSTGVNDTLSSDSSPNDVNLSVKVEDGDNSTIKNVSFYDASNDNLIDSKSSVSNNTRVQVVWENLSSASSFKWYVVVDDGSNTYTTPDYSFSTEINNNNNIIEDFERANNSLSFYSGDTANFTVNQTSPVYNGNYSLKSSSPNVDILADEIDLNASISQGESINVYWRDSASGSDDRANFCVFAEGIGSNDGVPDNGLCLGFFDSTSAGFLSSPENSFYLYSRYQGSGNKRYYKNVSWVTNNWYRGNITYNSNGSVSAELYNVSNGDKLASMYGKSFPNSYVNNTGVLFGISGDSNTGTNIFDYVNKKEVTTSITISDPFPSNGSNVIGNTSLAVNVSDPQNDDLNVSFRGQNGSIITTNTGVSSGTNTSTAKLNLSPGVFNWQVNATDGVNSTKAGNYSFTVFEELYLNITNVDNNNKNLTDAHDVHFFDNGTRAYVSDRNGGSAMLYNTTDKSNISLLQELDTPELDNTHYSVIGPSGNYTYNSYSSGITVLEIGVNNNSLTQVGSASIGSSNQEPVVVKEENGTASAVAMASPGSNKVFTINVSDKSNPSQIDSIGGSGSPNYMDGVRHLDYNSSRKILYYAADINDEHIGTLNLSNLSAISLIDVKEVEPGITGNDPHGVHVWGDYLYVADMQVDDANGWGPGTPQENGAFFVYNVSDSSSITRLVEFNQTDNPRSYLSAAHGVTFDKDRELLGVAAQKDSTGSVCNDNNCGFNVLNISDRDSPELLGSTRMGGLKGPSQEIDFFSNYVVSANHGRNSAVTNIVMTKYEPTISTTDSGGDTNDPSLTIDAPTNQTYNSSSLDLNVTSTEAVNFTYNVDGGSNTTANEDDKDLNTSLTGLSDGSHTVNVYGTDAAGNTGSASETFTVNTGDSTPPKYRNFQDNVSSNVSLGQKANISLEIYEQGSGLDEIWVEANQSGRTLNYTLYESGDGAGQENGRFYDDFESGSAAGYWESDNGDTFSVVSTSNLTGSNAWNVTNSSNTKEYTPTGDYYNSHSFEVYPVSGQPEIGFGSSDLTLTEGNLYFDSATQTIQWYNQTDTIDLTGFNYGENITVDTRFYHTKEEVDINITFSNGTTESFTKGYHKANSLDFPGRVTFTGSNSAEYLVDEVIFENEGYGNLWDFTAETTYNYSLFDLTYQSDLFSGRLEYKVWMQDAQGNKNKTGTKEFVVGDKPDVDQAQVKWENIGGSTVQDVILGYSDKDTISNVASPPSGSLSSNNSEATVTGWNSPFNWKGNVDDAFGFTGSRDVNFTANDQGLSERSGFSQSLDTQRFQQTVNLSVTGDPVNVSISFNDRGTVIQSGTKTVDGVSSSVSSTEVWEVDNITDEKNYDAKPVTQNIQLGTNFTATRQFETNNTRSFKFTGVDTGGKVRVNSKCTGTNTSTIDVGSGVSNTTLGLDCSSGSKTLNTPVDKTSNADADNDTHYYLNGTMNTDTNISEKSNVYFDVHKNDQNLNDWADRDTTTVELYIDGQAKNNLTVQDLSGKVRLNFTDDCCSSSPSKGSHNFSLFYEVGSGDTTIIQSGGGGGGGGSGSQERSVYINDPNKARERLNPRFGTEDVVDLEVVNTVRQDVTVTFDVGDDGICKYMQVETGVGTGEYADTGRYEIGAATNTLGTVENSTSVGVRFDLPSKEALENSSIGDLSCEVGTAPSTGVSEDLVVAVDDKPSLLQQFINFLNNDLGFNDVLHRIELGQLSSLDSIESKGEFEFTVGHAVGLILSIPIALFGYRRI